MSDRCGGLERRSGLLEPVLTECLQTLGVFPKCLEPIDILRLGSLFNKGSHQAADFRVEPVLQSLLKDQEDLDRILPGGVHGQSEIDQRVGGRSVALDQLFEQSDGRIRLPASQFDAGQQPGNAGSVRDAEDRGQFVGQGVEKGFLVRSRGTVTKF